SSAWLSESATTSTPLHNQLNPNTRPDRGLWLLRALYFGDASTSRRTIRAPITHTAASIFSGESGDSLPIDTPHRFGRRRAFATCRATLESPSCVKRRSFISVSVSSHANVNSWVCDRMSHAIGCGSLPSETAHTSRSSPYRSGQVTLTKPSHSFTSAKNASTLYRSNIRATAASTSATGTTDSVVCAGSGSHTPRVKMYPSDTRHPISAVASRLFDPSKNATISSPSATTWVVSVSAAHAIGVTHASCVAVGWFR